MTKYNFLILLGLMSCFGLRAEVVHVANHGFIVKNTITTDQEPEKVWSALIHHVDKWWPKDHSWWGEQGTFAINAQAGGCFCETFGDRSAEHMHISYVDPLKLLRMTGGLGPLQGMGVYGSLDWAFDTSNESTKVTLTYSVTGISETGFEKLAPIVAQVQGIQLNGLKQFVEKPLKTEP